METPFQDIAMFFWALRATHHSYYSIMLLLSLSLLNNLVHKYKGEFSNRKKKIKYLYNIEKMQAKQHKGLTIITIRFNALQQMHSSSGLAEEENVSFFFVQVLSMETCAFPSFSSLQPLPLNLHSSTQHKLLLVY